MALIADTSKPQGPEGAQETIFLQKNNRNKKGERGGKSHILAA